MKNFFATTAAWSIPLVVLNVVTACFLFWSKSDSNIYNNTDEVEVSAAASSLLNIYVNNYSSFYPESSDKSSATTTINYTSLAVLPE